MNILEQLTLLLTRARNFILTHRRLIFVIGSCFLVLFAIAVGIIVYNTKQQAKRVDQFYKLVFHDLTGVDATKDGEIVNDYLQSNTNNFFQTYVGTMHLKESLSKQDFEKAASVLDNIDTQLDDDLLADFAVIEKSNSYLQLKNYEAAAKTVDLIQSKALEDMQLLLLARIELAQNNKQTAQKILDSFMENFSKSPLINIAKNYQYLIN